MAGPWEKYAAPEPAASGPWDKYGAAPPSAENTPAAPSWGQQFLDATGDRLRDVGSAFYGASATANRIFANLADIGEGFVKNTAGIEASAPIRNLSGILRANQEAQQNESARLAGGRNDLAAQVTRGV